MHSENSFQVVGQIHECESWRAFKLDQHIEIASATLVTAHIRTKYGNAADSVFPGQGWFA
jgi:hypothetical protein